MTNFEAIMQMTEEQFGHFLCALIPPTDDCDEPCEHCPMQDKCLNGHDGFIRWLKDEVTR
jgi:hypothetical protein